MKELDFNELSTRQKLGMTMIGYLEREGENLDFILKLIREHSLGGVWIPQRYDKEGKLMAAVKSCADYPILVFCDAEGGVAPFFIGKHNALGIAGKPELAKAFGKIVGVLSRNAGYTVVCNPVLDMVDRNMTCAASDRSLGSDKFKVSSLAAAMVEGMHEGGVLSVAKHYPGTAPEDANMDSHMAETFSLATKEELLDYNLYPYIELIRRGLLDGIMTKHARFKNIDPDLPASLSAKVIGVIREQGFDGIALTDALCMSGVLSKFGKGTPAAMAISGGNDLSLPFMVDNDVIFDCIVKYYEEGNLSDERLDEAVKRVLAAQHKTTLLPKGTYITEADKILFERISSEAVYAILDGGVEHTVSREGKHFFLVLTDINFMRGAEELPAVDTVSAAWHKPYLIRDKIKSLFPNSEVRFISEFPTRTAVNDALVDNLEYEDVVFVSYFSGAPYMGIEHFTPRIISTVEALQVDARISAVVHMGNPYVLEDLAHVPRIIVGCASEDSSLKILEVLAGELKPLGVPTYNVDLC